MDAYIVVNSIAIGIGLLLTGWLACQHWQSDEKPEPARKKRNTSDSGGADIGDSGSDCGGDSGGCGGGDGGGD